MRYDDVIAKLRSVSTAGQPVKLVIARKVQEDQQGDVEISDVHVRYNCNINYYCDDIFHMHVHVHILYMYMYMYILYMYILCIMCTCACKTGNATQYVIMGQLTCKCIHIN